MSIDLVENVKNAGVVGAGGAGFPTHIKLKSKVDTYIANGAECEPLLRVDQHLMKQFPEKIIRGLQLGMEASGATRGILGIKAKYKQAIRVLRKVIKTDDRLEIKLLDNTYPAGDEHILVYEVTTRLVPESGIPLNVGVVVNNIATLINIEAASRGIPVTSRYVTVTGAVKKPKTVKFPIGTPIREAIKIAGGAVINPFKVVMGGPMMGHVTSNLETPIIKTSSGIIVLPESHYVIQMKEQRISLKVVVTKAACIRCQFCTLVCPRYLIG
ncbi:MAG: SLBB domain-containing protein, partial [Candidatus Hodarchaeales archaeon]